MPQKPTPDEAADLCRKLLPLLDALTADDASAKDRVRLRELVGQEQIHELYLRLHWLQSERAFNNREK